MPVTMSPLMAIALNSNMRIHERIEAIKNSDGVKGISSDEEARAILAIPNSELKWCDNKEGLMTEKMLANSYLKNHGRCLRDDAVDLYRYCKAKGGKLIARFLDRISPSESVVARK